MTRTLLPLALLLSLLLALAGCGSPEAPAASPEQPAPSSAAPDPALLEPVDLDLTQMSSTMVYSEIYNLMMSPEDYVGKTIRMRGQFNVYEDPSSNTNYYYVVIADATACCQQGLEFVWTGDHAYPEDYPPDGSEITATGVFTPYEDSAVPWYHLVCETISF